MLTGGQVADCTAGELLLEQMPQASMLHGDKGYDSNAIRRQIEGKGAMPNIPPKANRRWKNCFSPLLYRNRNAIERMFGRLKDFRRIATRYDRLADNFLAAVCLAATVSYWLSSPDPSKCTVDALCREGGYLLIQGGKFSGGGAPRSSIASSGNRRTSSPALARVRSSQL